MTSRNMSYDIQIWSVDPLPLPEALPDAKKWQPEGSAWVRVSKHWQIVVGSSVKALPEDVPLDIVGLLPGIGYLAELNLEPIGAPKSARRLLETVAKRLAKAAHGVVLDQQTDRVLTPSGIRRYRPQRRDERFSILFLSWWFTEGPLLSDAGLREFVDLLESMLPEAMPRRYGLFEPPQHLYAETGKAHFLKFLEEYRDAFVVWYPHRPVVSVSLSWSRNWGAARQGFRANYLKVGVEAGALEQPGWPTALDRFWREASQVIRPFYGDVRILCGFLPMGGTYGSDTETEFHPAAGPWWTGIPRVVGQAAVLGEPYLALWPDFVEAAETVDDLAFLSTSNWTTREEVSGLAGGVPEPVAQRWVPEWTSAAPLGGKTINWNTEFPPVWPFGNAGAG